MVKKLRTASLKSEFTGSYKKVYLQMLYLFHVCAHCPYNIEQDTQGRKNQLLHTIMLI